jgi:uncharacterized protein (TIGR03000 family)
VVTFILHKENNMRNRLFLSGLVAVMALALVAESADAQYRGRGWRGGRGWDGGNSWSVGISDGGIGVSYGRGYGYPYYGGYYGNRSSFYGSPYWGGGYSYYNPGSYYYDSSPSFYYSSPSYAYGGTYYSSPSMAYSSPSYSSGIMMSDEGVIRQTSYSSPAANVINLRVLVPDANARIWIENQEMSIQGTERLFFSPPVETGKTYTYTVKASWMENGKEVTREKKQDVSAGQEYFVNFNEAASSSSSSTPPAPAPERRDDNRSDTTPAPPRPNEPGLLDSDKPTEFVVVSAGNGTLVVTNVDGLNRQTFTVPSEATITLDGQSSMLSDLREGQRIRVTSKGEGTNRSILKIEARAKRDNP